MLVRDGHEQFLLVIETVVLVLGKALPSRGHFYLGYDKDPGEEVVASVGDLVDFELAIGEELVLG